MAYVRWPVCLEDQDAYVFGVIEWWIRRCGILKFLGGPPPPDVLETSVVNIALLALAIGLKQVLKKLRRGEAIPFDEVRMAAYGQLRRDLIWEYWERLGKDRGMPAPLVNWRELTSKVEALVARSTLREKIDALLYKIARAAAQPPTVASAPVATTPTNAAEPGAPLPAAISQPDADVAPEIASGANMPAGEVHPSTSPTDLALLDRLHRQLGDWDRVAAQIKWDGQESKLSRSTLLEFRAAQLGKNPSRPLKDSTAQKIAEGIRLVAVKLKILPG